MKAILILSAFASAVASFVLGLLYSSGALRLPSPSRAPTASVNPVASPVAATPPAQAPAAQAPSSPPAPQAPAAPADLAGPPTPEPTTVAGRRVTPEEGSPWSRAFRGHRREETDLRVTNESGRPVAIEVDPGRREISLSTTPRGCLPMLHGCDVRTLRVRPDEYRIVLDGCPMRELVRFDPRRDYTLEVVPCEADPSGAMARLLEDGRVVFQTMLGGVPRHADVTPAHPMPTSYGR